MSKGTILYVGNFKLPDGGASANRVVSNGKIFASLGYKVVFLGVSDDHFDGIRPADFSSGAFSFIAFEESYPSTNAQWLRHMISVRNIKAVAAVCDDLRSIFLYNAPFSLLVAVKTAFKRTRIIYDCTEWNPYSDGNIIKRKIKTLDESLIRRRAGKTSDGIIVISKRMLSQYGDSAVLIPPLVDIEDPIWHSEPIPHEGFELCFAGDINGSKECLDSIVRAVSSVNGAVLKVIGVEEELFRKKYPKEVFSSEKVIFTGRLSHAETIAHVLSTDCYIFIRRSDLRNNAGFPTKFSEAFTAGVPIITTDVSDISDYMTPERGIVLDSTDPEAITAAIKKVMYRPKRKRSLDDTFDFRKYINLSQNKLYCFFNQ